MFQKFKEFWENHSKPGRDICQEIFKLVKVSKNNIVYKIKNTDYNIKYETWMEEITSSDIREFIRDIKIDLHDADEELIESNVKYKMQTQKYMDTNRIERKSFREHVRIVNSLEDFTKNLKEALEKLNPVTIKHEDINNNCFGIVHISDCHFNELINIVGNKYDFNVAAKRLKLLSIKTKNYFSSLNIKNILIARTGDDINSDRRLDELLNMSTNRANACMLAFYLYEQFILDLNQDFNITIATVSGNESRIKDEHGFSDLIATDNYDFTIENMLRIAFRNCDGIKFIDGDAKEKVVKINNNNILLLHGEGLTKDTEKSIQQKIGQYSVEEKIDIDYVLLGHLHSTRIGDFYSRCSSLCGSNDYSKKQLNLSGRASQNLIILNGKSIDAIKVDLQNTGDVKGYDIIEVLKSYNAKSADKCKKGIISFQVII